MTDAPTPHDEARSGATANGASEDTRAQRHDTEDRSKSGLLHALREFVIVVGLALILSLAVKTWLLQAFFIPSASMENTLLVGDRVVVSKLSPSPFALQRGDIVVFEDSEHWLQAAPHQERSGVSAALHDSLVFVGLLPNDSDSHLIKRVIGLPGDKVTCCTADGKITVNGAAITEPYLKQGDAPSINPFDITVPDGRIWVMGDHRSDSGDSRYHDPSGTGKDGSIPMDDVVGRAVVVVWPFSDMTWLSRPSEVFAKVPAAK